MAPPWYDGSPLIPRYGYPGTMAAADGEESVPSGLRASEEAGRMMAQASHRLASTHAAHAPKIGEAFLHKAPVALSISASSCVALTEGNGRVQPCFPHGCAYGTRAFRR